MRRWYRKYKPGWFVWNPGSGGGPATVDTDDVTLQGNGSAANKIRIKQVETDGTLTGAGTAASPLSVVSTPSSFFSVSAGGYNLAVPQNQTILMGFYLPYPLSFSKIYFNISVVDAGNNSDVGLYNAAGTLVADIGAQALGTLYGQTIATVQGLQTIQPGLYLFAATTAGNVLTLVGGVDVCSWMTSSVGGVTAGGSLAASITPPARSPNSFSYQFGLST